MTGLRGGGSRSLSLSVDARSGAVAAFDRTRHLAKSQTDSPGARDAKRAGGGLGPPPALSVRISSDDGARQSSTRYAIPQAPSPACVPMIGVPAAVMMSTLP